MCREYRRDFKHESKHVPALRALASNYVSILCADALELEGAEGEDKSPTGYLKSWLLQVGGTVKGIRVTDLASANWSR